jgi:hypothetical protein
MKTTVPIKHTLKELRSALQPIGAHSDSPTEVIIRRGELEIRLTPSGPRYTISGAVEDDLYAAIGNLIPPELVEACIEWSLVTLAKSLELEFGQKIKGLKKFERCDR